MNRDPRAWARLGQALKQAREHAGLTQAEVAQRANVSTVSVQSAESGTVPKRRMPYTLAHIARALGWPAGAIDAVLDGKEPPGGWRDIPVRLSRKRFGAIMSHAMLRAADNITAAEIRAATDTAIAELRKEGMITDEDGPDENSNAVNS